MRRSPPSLQRRLLWLILSTLVGAWLLGAAWSWVDASHELDELLDAHLAQAAALLVVQQSADLGEAAEARNGLQAPPLSRYAPRVAFLVFHEERLVLQSAGAAAQGLSANLAMLPTGYQTRRLGDQAWRLLVAAGAEQDVKVLVAEQLGSRQDILRAVLRSALAPMVLLLPVLIPLLWWAVRRGLAPLRTLGEQLAVRTPADLQPLHGEAAPGEMRPLLQALNGLLARIEALMAAERRFTADAAHELRNPVAAVSAQLQVALRERDPARLQLALQQAQQASARSARLVDQLLLLSRLESGEQVPLQRLDLSALCRETAAALVPMALQRDQEVVLEAPDRLMIEGNALLLGALLRNLLDNASRHGPAGIGIRLSLSEQTDGIRLRLEDGGPGLSEPELRRLGERFYRPAASDQGQGSGLGWSIVMRIAKAHGAGLSLGRSERLGGLQVDVLLPRPAPGD
ncbi:histidine kinase dimerization/phospho-acceptor domain-containing protein [Paucibacter sp. APW11]|uniref:histidine kinase n=1 Tax=Roseateles aquae TaxID=3077235 RepID=A0ABU3PDS8_9BURK|nr:ATP-binding protein [Paucibacter sp. APW11]MDT9000719.1 histidine kinase dimerization/phospho-acceptor domain-containing protein [Paucibacter sp. APW11]